MQRDACRLERCVRLACRMEVLAPKPGNVAPGRPFDDVTVADFVTSADLAAPHLARAAEIGVGLAVLNAAREVRRSVGTNTNLGILLLLGPLCAVREQMCLAEGIESVLRSLTPRDAGCIYEAIRIARPGGLGRSRQYDVVSGQVPENLLEAMWLAAVRDRVAAQYVTGFEDVFRLAREIGDAVARTAWQIAVRDVFVRELARFPDSLIVRKCGVREAERVRRRAAQLERLLQNAAPQAERELEAFDAWLRSEGHRRNPGTTADLVAAALFVALRDGPLDAEQFDELLHSPIGES